MHIIFSIGRINSSKYVCAYLCEMLRCCFKPRLRLSCNTSDRASTYQLDQKAHISFLYLHRYGVNFIVNASMCVCVLNPIKRTPSAGQDYVKSHKKLTYVYNYRIMKSTQ